MCSDYELKGVRLISEVLKNLIQEMRQKLPLSMSLPDRLSLSLSFPDHLTVSHSIPDSLHLLQRTINPSSRIQDAFTEQKEKRQKGRSEEGEKKNRNNMGPTDSPHVTVLTIDGGGIRGLIPSVVLTSLEKMLQVIKLSD